MKEGCIRFNSLRNFRNEDNSFRGDKNEGAFIPKKMLIGEFDVTPFKPRLSLVGSDCVMIFCASILDDANSKIVDNASLTMDMNDEFLNEMRQFGDWAVVFDLADFVDNVNMCEDISNYNRIYNPIEYIDKNNYTKVQSFNEKCKDTLGLYSIYFIKDGSYGLQNEWRYIIDPCTANIACNNDGSLDLKLRPFRTSNIFSLIDGK